VRPAGCKMSGHEHRSKEGVAADRDPHHCGRLRSGASHLERQCLRLPGRQVGSHQRAAELRWSRRDRWHRSANRRRTCAVMVPARALMQSRRSQQSVSSARRLFDSNAWCGKRRSGDVPLLTWSRSVADSAVHGRNRAGGLRASAQHFADAPRVPKRDPLRTVTSARDVKRHTSD
jgi:hypothetical protein